MLLLLLLLRSSDLVQDVCVDVRGRRNLLRLLGHLVRLLGWHVRGIVLLRRLFNPLGLLNVGRCGLVDDALSGVVKFLFFHFVGWTMGTRLADLLT